MATAAAHEFKSTDAFRPLAVDQRVLYESGAEAFADRVARALPRSVKTVEDAQFGEFVKPVKIYVCATPQSFENMTGRIAKGLTYRGSVFLSPRLMEYPENVGPYLTHELSHLMLLQHMGLYKAMVTPPWFKEGLAVYVSQGAGAGGVSEPEAARAILSGKTFEPNTGGGAGDFLFPQNAHHWHLKPHMFYRQASLFVAFLHQYDKEAFRKLLVAMQRGQGFNASFELAYGTSTWQMWPRFVASLRSAGRIGKDAS